MFGRHVLAIDAARAAEDIATSVREQVLGTLRRRGAVVGLSGGIDSSVVAALCVRALGRDRVLGLLMPERDSSSDALRLGQVLAHHLGIDHRVEDVAPTLEALGCYASQLDAVRSAVPEFGGGWRCKLVLPSPLEGDRLNVTLLTVAGPDGDPRTVRMSAPAYRQLVAATNFKQRVRATMAYYHADRLGYAVAGTPNRAEYDQGFFVKHGDGAADFKPIAHLYKTQVYALAEYLAVPAEIRHRPPTTDTFSLEQSQEEFFFGLPYADLDLCLWGASHGTPASEVAEALRLTVAQVERVYRDIEAKRRASRYLHQPPLLVEGG